jgi:hypothetical protein
VADEPKTKAEVVNLLANAAHRGSLGLFLGTGFSIAVTRGGAPTWESLLVSAAKELGLNDPFADPKQFKGRSYPEIAGQIVVELCVELEKQKQYAGLSPFERSVGAKLQFKEMAARLVANLQPHDDEKTTFHTAYRYWHGHSRD